MYGQSGREQNLYDNDVYFRSLEMMNLVLSVSPPSKYLLEM